MLAYMVYNYMYTLQYPTQFPQEAMRTRKAFFQHVFYAEVVTASLIHTATSNSYVATVLANITQQIPQAQNAQTEIQPPIITERDLSLISPRDEYVAMRKAEWLMAQIIEKTIPGYAEAVRLITRWQEEHESSGDAEKPEFKRQLIVGVITVAIPGITMGRFKNKEPMAIIMRDDIAESMNPVRNSGKVFQSAHDQNNISNGMNTRSIARMIPDTVLSVLEQAFTLAHGNTQHLEPEMADWFFGERLLIFYAANGRHMVEAQKDLLHLSIMHGTAWAHGGPAILAVSPAVNSTCIEQRWELEQIQI